MPKWAKWAIWAVIALVAYRVISHNPASAGHTVSQFFASLWTFLGSI